MSDEDEDLSQRLAHLLGRARDSSSFALQTFLDAVEQGVKGASLTIEAPGRPGGPPEIRLEIDPRKP